tara:strand:+ start:255 stop:2264 length:2010 start_codon:yes stop_codon:yes gene_type:complete
MVYKLIIKKLYVLFSIGLIFNPLLSSNEVFEASDSTLKIISESYSAQEGDTLLVGLNFKLDSGWHTYWKNPGDAGGAAEVIWNLPEKVTASEILWPGPEMIPVEPLMTYGYEDEVTLLTELKIGEEAKFPIKIEGKVAWYTCKEICIPQEGTISLWLNKGKKLKSDFYKDLLLTKNQVPLEISYPHRINKLDGRIILEIELDKVQEIEKVNFFPNKYGLINYATKQNLEQNNKSLSLVLEPSKIEQNIERFAGVIEIIKNQSIEYYEIDLPIENKDQIDSPSMSILTALLFAFLGGIILNIMPCVFPILSIKILSFINHSHGSKTKLFQHGLVFSIGVLVTFISIGALLLILKSGGEYIGWGFQLQSPIIVTLLMYLFIAIGVVFISDITLGSRLAAIGNFSSDRTDLSGSFLTGVLAVIVASPCTAPFMGSALGLALLQPGLHSIFIFIALGFGFSLPYLVLTINPKLLQKLPKPGQWMETLKQFMAFPMWASAIWLAWILSSQVGNNELMLAIFGSLLIAASLWTLDKSKLLAVVFLIVSFVFVPTTYSASEPSQEDTTYSSIKLEELRNQNVPVFVNFTADWCITCKVNESVALNQSSVKELIDKKGIVYLRADWTRKDEIIAQELYKYGRTGVPLYLLFPSGQKPIILPELLTEDLLLNYLEQVN